MQHTIIRPVITEQSMAAAQTGKFTFIVDRAANKDAIRAAVEEAFKVKVVGISTITIKGKTKRTGVRRIEVAITPIKKAVVQLASGQKIDLFTLGGTE